jgi:predicted ester cyclase
MTAEQNKTLLRRIPEEIFNKGNLAIAGEIFAADYIEHVALPPGIPSGLPGLKLFVTALRAAFPDLRYHVDDEIAEGDKVVQRATVDGTMRGEFQGMPATGKHATWTEIHVSRVAGGKLVEHWATVDQLGMLQQLGVIPTAEPSGA